MTYSIYIHIYIQNSKTKYYKHVFHCHLEDIQPENPVSETVKKTLQNTDKPSLTIPLIFLGSSESHCLEYGEVKRNLRIKAQRFSPWIKI